MPSVRNHSPHIAFSGVVLPVALLKWVAALAAICALPALLMAAGVPLVMPVVAGVVHAALEASILAAAAATFIMTLLQHREGKEPSLPLIGLALMFAACLDAFHLFTALNPADPTLANSNTGPIAWAIGRATAAVVMIFGVALFALRRRHDKKLLSNRLNLLALLVVAGVAWAFLLNALHTPALPDAIFPELSIKRPFDLAPLGLFLVGGLVIFPMYAHRHPGPFAYALILMVVPQTAAQLYMALGSVAPMDSAAVAAHLLKSFAYLAPLGGMMVEFYRTCSQRDRLRKELAKSEQSVVASTLSKEEFLGAMSREIRTPMNGVMGMTRLMLDTELSAEQREYAKAIQLSAGGLLKLLSDIQDYSIVEAGRMELSIESFDLNDIFEDVLERFGFKAAEKQLQISGCLHPEIPTALIGDSERLRQVLTNFADNAVKFTEEGDISIRATQIFDDGTAVKLRFEIEDTGSGIREEDLPRLFQSFAQIGGPNARRYSGSGLGLAISSEIVKLMGGDVGVESELGEGSTFWFTVRLHKQIGAMGLVVPGLDDLATTRIMVADANRGNRETMHTHLNAWGCRTSEVGDAWDLIHGLRDADEEENHIQVALIDLELPGMEIANLCEKLADDPAVQETRFLAMAPADKSAYTEVLREGVFDAILTKPIKKALLRASLRNVLGMPQENASHNDAESTSKPAGSGQEQSSSPEVGSNTEVAAPMEPSVFATEEFAHGIHILLAEDNLVNQKVAVKHLEKLGCTVEVVGNGNQAVAAVTNGGFDMVLMDCQMPGMEGYEATAAIRQLDGELSKVPIVAMTANAMVGDRERCLESGMDDYVSKPFDMDDLVRIFHEWLPQLAAE
jgi:signal transduction histidine kinase/CheY-like chemotaxis protein